MLCGSQFFLVSPSICRRRLQTRLVLIPERYENANKTDNRKEFFKLLLLFCENCLLWNSSSYCSLLVANSYCGLFNFVKFYENSFFLLYQANNIRRRRRTNNWKPAKLALLLCSSTNHRNLRLFIQWKKHNPCYFWII